MIPRASLDAAQEPVPVLGPEEGGKVQQQVPPGGQAQHIQHTIRDQQGVVVLAVALQVLHQLLVCSGRQALLQSGQIGLCILLPFVLS